MNPTAPCGPRLRSIADRTRPAWTPDAFRKRALELMVAHQGSWGSVGVLAHEVDRAGRLVWIEIAVPSTRAIGLLYRVRYLLASDSVTCGCEDGQRGQPCFHAGVALAYGRETAAAQRHVSHMR